MDDEFLLETTEILNTLDQLGEQLIKIPMDRIIKCYVEQSQNNNLELIGKPRFDPSQRPLDTELKESFFKLRKKILDYFDEYIPHKNNEDIERILCSDYSNSNIKHSVLKLMEGDVWGNPKIYGDYRIEIINNTIKYNIYNTRFEKIRRIVTKEQIFQDSQELEDFVIQDAINQIQNEFQRLWTLLKQSIIECKIEYESLQKRYKDFIPKITLKETLIDGENILPKNKYISVLALGYVTENYLKNEILHLKEDTYFSIIIETAYNSGSISKNERNIFHKIRNIYNKIKHNPRSNPEPKKIKKLYQDLKVILSKKISI